MDDISQQIEAWTDHVNRSTGAAVEPEEIIDGIRLPFRPPLPGRRRPGRIFAAAAALVIVVGGITMLATFGHSKTVSLTANGARTEGESTSTVVGASPTFTPKEVLTPTDIDNVCEPKGRGSAAWEACLKQASAQGGPATLAVRKRAGTASYEAYFGCMESRGYHPKDTAGEFDFGPDHLNGFPTDVPQAERDRPGFQDDETACLRASDDAFKKVWAPYEGE